MKFEKRVLEYHPLLLEESKGHYDVSGQNNIIDFEAVSTLANAFGAINYNLIKYANRDKGQDALDEKKIETFRGWYALLQDLLELGYDYDTNLRFAMKSEYPDMKYSLSEG